MRRHAFGILMVAIISIAIGVAVFMYTGDSMSSFDVPISGAGLSVPFIELASGEQSTVTKRVNYVIRSKAELGDLWKMIEGQDSLVPPTVDFKKYDVIAVFAGQEATSGYGVSIPLVEDGQSRKVHISLTRPSRACLLAQTVTSPYFIIQVPKTTLPLTHEDTEEVLSCL